MKKYLVLCCSFAFFLLSCSSKVEKVAVPEMIETRFKNLYPNVDHAEWELEKGMYEASFKIGKVESSVTFEADGSVFQTESEMDVALLPQSIKDYLSSLLGNKEITSAEKNTDNLGVVTFEAEVGGVDYLFDNNGHFLGKEEEEDKDGKEEKE